MFLFVRSLTFWILVFCDRTTHCHFTLVAVCHRLPSSLTNSVMLISRTLILALARRRRRRRRLGRRGNVLAMSRDPEFTRRLEITYARSLRARTRRETDRRAYHQEVSTNTCTAQDPPPQKRPLRSLSQRPTARTIRANGATPSGVCMTLTSLKALVRWPRPYPRVHQRCRAELELRRVTTYTFHSSKRPIRRLPLACNLRHLRRRPIGNHRALRLRDPPHNSTDRSTAGTLQIRSPPTDRAQTRIIQARAAVQLKIFTIPYATPKPHTKAWVFRPRCGANKSAPNGCASTAYTIPWRSLRGASYARHQRSRW